jgi:hypothetical protein
MSEEHVEPNKARYIRLNELDKPIHHIIPLWRFEEALRIKSLTFVKPSQWEDPFEDPCAHVLVQRKGTQKELAPHLRQAWAQCWSYEAESDVLLRAYSRVDVDPQAKRNRDPAREGVRITTTTRKLLRQLHDWQEKCPGDHFYAGSVIYQQGDGYLAGLCDVLIKEGEAFFGTPDGRAESLWRKRARFQHENEVRLLCIGPDRHDKGDPIRRFPFDPNLLINEVAFDPRLALFERREREAAAKALGYDGAFLDRGENVKPFCLCVRPDDVEHASPEASEGT